MKRRRVVNGQVYIWTRRGWRLVVNGCIRTRKGWRKMRRRPAKSHYMPAAIITPPVTVEADSAVTAPLPQHSDRQRPGRYDALHATGRGEGRV